MSLVCRLGASLLVKHPAFIRALAVCPQLTTRLEHTATTLTQQDPPSPVLFVSRFPYTMSTTELKRLFPGCVAASVVPKKKKQTPKPKKPKQLTESQLKKMVVSKRNPTKGRRWKPMSDDDLGLGRQGYVEYSSVEEASEALKKMNNKVVGVRRLNVLFASPTRLSVIPHRVRAQLKEERQAAAAVKAAAKAGTKTKYAELQF